MPVVRCPIHRIPYNSANPRGCPACWREKQGESSDADLMRQLARLSMGLPAMEEPPAPKPPPGGPPPGIPATPPEGYRGQWPPPVTIPPRRPAPELTALQRIWRWIVAHPSISLGVVILVVAGPLLWVITRAPFEPDPQPPFPTGDPLPVSLSPNVPIAAAFAVYGTVPPLANPAAPSLAHYDWGNGVRADALNGMLYAVTVTATDRSLLGLRVGAPETPAQGALALLGPVHEPDLGIQPSAIPIQGWQVVTTLDERPERHLVAEVRPPNGCLDVQVILAPRAVGRLRQDDGDLWALARVAAPFEWVVVQVRTVSRMLPGPYAGEPACDAL